VTPDPRPRVLLVGRTRFALPLEDGLRRKFDALQARMELRVVAGARSRSSGRDATFRLLRPIRPRALDGVWFHVSLPARVGWHLRRFEPDVVLVQGAHEAGIVLLARMFARSRTRVVLDVHGDWRLTTRAYGSRARRLLSVPGDLIAGIAIRRADALRTVSSFTSGLVRSAGAEPTAEFPAFIDFEAFQRRPQAPVPERPVALFVGALERYKNIDRLLDAWRLAAAKVPEAQLRVVGTGSRRKMVDRLVRELPGRILRFPELDAEEVAAQLDAATCLVLPSAREGMGRVVVEAFLRGRPVIAAKSGGVPELVRNGENGLLVDAGETRALADAVVRLLSEPALATRLGSAARGDGERIVIDPSEYAASVLALVIAATAAADRDVPAAAAAPARSG
jgi:glycosyltransferase involved in cell wall biosynthesis